MSVCCVMLLSCYCRLVGCVVGWSGLSLMWWMCLLIVVLVCCGYIRLRLLSWCMLVVMW